MNIENVAMRNDHVENPTTRPGRFRNLILGLTVAILSTQLVGCCNFPKANLFDGSMIDSAFGCYRDKVWAKRACNLRFSSCDRPYGEHFQAGFEAGYTDICNGGDGYVPATPPEGYWGFEYQTPDGSQCVNAWFEGYPSGVAAAKRDRAGTYRNVYVSKMIQSAIAQDKAPKTTPSKVQVVSPQDSNVVPIQQATPGVQPAGASTIQANHSDDPSMVAPSGASSIAPASFGWEHQ